MNSKRLSELRHKGHITDSEYKELKLALITLEKRPQGEWIESEIPNEKYVCSKCGGACWYYDYEGEVAKSRFCPNCGADMRKEEDND